MSKLVDLLNDLGAHGDVYDEYLEDPEGVMRRYELSSEEIKAMLSKDVEKLKKLSGLNNLKSNSSVHSHDP